MTREKRGSVVVYTGPEQEPEHQRTSHHEVARRLASLLGRAFAGEYDASANYRESLYFVPIDAIVIDEARRLGIRDEHDLFGGVVSQPFMATKAIAHPLCGNHATAPPGWSEDFCRRVSDAVLTGYSAFSLEDAHAAGLRLLECGPARIKSVRATAGRGQAAVSDAADLTRVLNTLDAEEVAIHGLVLEEHLADVTTYSVGQVRVGEYQASYYGTQHLTEDNEGAMVYGGTDLVVTRGDFEALLALELPVEILRVIAQALVFDTAATECFPAFFASRRNYDVACGSDARGNRRVGVLEQSWRIGGASSAEVVALEALQATPAPRVVSASSHEIYGTKKTPPSDATILYSGVDADVGPITKCVTVNAYDDKQ
ncbi:DUF3182 family protein [Halomonas korlensis]|uniref:Biotin carboxylase n=1 Tax=Halomonas korlensis TaxID=463301 RepID=A0A1I7IAZ7_9GAMM|nr:DUF3182 family protein [Halomonas korlensis]SFU70000.1 Protein of unknown function [Halomonas korlensis]